MKVKENTGRYQLTTMTHKKSDKKSDKASKAQVNSLFFIFLI